VDNPIFFPFSAFRGLGRAANPWDVPGGDEGRAGSRSGFRGRDSGPSCPGGAASALSTKIAIFFRPARLRTPRKATGGASTGDACLGGLNQRPKTLPGTEKQARVRSEGPSPGVEVEDRARGERGRVVPGKRGPAKVDGRRGILGILTEGRATSEGRSTADGGLFPTTGGNHRRKLGTFGTGI